MKEINRELLEKLITDYDENADISIGGPYDVHVITPLLDRLDPDPLEVDFSSFARTLLKDRNPDLEFEEGDALSTAVAKPMQFLVRPILDQLSIMQRNGSLRNYTSMDSEEIDALLGNLFWSRPEGGYATCPVRVYFSNPVTVQIGTGNYCTSKSGLKFIPTLPYSITADTMLSNKEGNRYYITIYVRAEKPGSDYNIAKDYMASISGVPSATAVKNTRKAQGGVDTYTDAEAVEAAQRAVTENTLTSDNGIITLLTKSIAGIRHIDVTGFHDAEMKRDIIRGGSAGAVIAYGMDADPIDDGDYDDSTQYISFNATDITDYLGSTGPVSDPYFLHINGVDYEVLEVLAADQVKVGSEIPYEPTRPIIASGTDLVTTAGSAVVESTIAVDFVANNVLVGMCLEITSGSDIGTYKIAEINVGSNPNAVRLEQAMSNTAPLGVNFQVYTGIPWTLRKKTLSLSEIPYGFLDSTDEVADEVHIGGMTDIHISGEREENSVSLLAIADQNPIVSGIDLQQASATEVESPTTTFEGTVNVGDQLLIKDGAAAGTYRILSVSGSTLWIDSSAVPAFTGARYQITATIDIELSDPLESLYMGNDLTAVLGTSTVTTASTVGFTDYGVEVGDYLRIETGDDQGDHPITAISGTGGEILTVSHTFSRSYTSLAFEIVSKQTAVDLPVIDIESVELLDTNSEPTDEYIPYGKPVDARALGPFTNIGHGEVSEFSGVETGIISDVDLTVPVVMGGSALRYSLNGGTLTNLIFPALYDPYSATDIADMINSYIPDCASVISVGGTLRIAIQSTNRLIEFGTGTANAILGIADSLPSESTDQLIQGAPGAYTDWVEEGITIRSVIKLSNDPNSYYKVYRIDGFANERVRAYKLFTDARFWLANQSVDMEVGERSLGIMRVYFKDPTFFSVLGPRKVADIDSLGSDDLPWMRDITKITADTGDYSLYFSPDQSMEDLLIPAGDSQPNNGFSSNGTDEFYSDISGGGVIDNRDPLVDFISWNVRVGDILELTTKPIIGDVDLAGALALAGDTLEFTLDGFDHVITFDANDTSISAVIDAINEGCGTTIAYKDISGANQFLVLETDLELNVTSDSGEVLHSPPSVPENNTHDDAGEYLIAEVGYGASQYALTVKNTDGTGVTFTVDRYNSHFKIKRSGMQVFDPADMTTQDDGLSYVDVEVMSEGFGDLWNVDELQLFTLEDYTCYGWYLSTENEATSYSEYEGLWIHITPYFLPQDEEYDPANLYELAGQNIQVVYNKSYVVEEAQSYVESEGVRNTCQNPLVRHLLPSFVYIDIEYSGGSDEATMEDSLEELIDSVRPGVELTSYDVSNTLSSKGAEDVTNPIDIVGLVWEDDRSIRIERSEDALSLGSRYVLYTGFIGLTQN